MKKNLIPVTRIGIRAVTGMLVLLVLGSVFGYMHLGNRSTAVSPDTLPAAQQKPAASPNESDVRPDVYNDLKSWALNNLKHMGRFSFARAAELAARVKPAAETPTAVPIAASNKLLQDYQAAFIRNESQRLGLDGPHRRAPFRVLRHEVIRQSFQGVAYDIEVVTWDAYPGFPVAANIYRLSKPLQPRLPVVIVPLGCQTHLAVHNDRNSFQRRAANLALRGFLVFSMASGVCFNGLAGERLENSYAFEQYGRMSGSGLSSRSIDLLMYMRAVDYLATREDVDIRRIGVTGYSYGGVLAVELAIHDSRIAAVGLAATSVDSEMQMDSRYFVYRKHPAMCCPTPDVFVVTWPAPPVFESENVRFRVPAVPNEWNASGNLILLAPRPFFIVQGREDPGTSVPASRKRIGALAELYRTVAPEAPLPQVQFVEGSHNYDAQRRRLLTDWLARVLQAEQSLPPPQDRFEHETAILDRKLLERTPPDFGKVSLRDIHAEKALATIKQQRVRQLFGRRSPQDARALLQTLLMLPGRDEPEPGPPIMLDDRGFTVADTTVSARFWLLQLTRRLNAAALTLEPEREVVKEIVVVLLSNGVLLDVLLPPLNQLVADLAAHRAVVVVYLPGFGWLRSAQDKLGNLAIGMPEKLDRTLLGVGVETVQAALGLTELLYPGAVVRGRSDGVDGGNVLAFATALDTRINSAHLSHAVATFQDFLTAPTHPIPAPTLAIPGLAAYVDIPDLQAFALPRRIVVETRSDLSEYVLDLRP